MLLGLQLTRSDNAQKSSSWRSGVVYGPCLVFEVHLLSPAGSGRFLRRRKREGSRPACGIVSGRSRSSAESWWRIGAVRGKRSRERRKRSSGKTRCKSKYERLRSDAGRARASDRLSRHFKSGVLPRSRPCGLPRRVGHARLLLPGARCLRRISRGLRSATQSCWSAKLRRCSSAATRASEALARTPSPASIHHRAADLPQPVQLTSTWRAVFRATRRHMLRSHGIFARTWLQRLAHRPSTM
mmetsp:Transcript_80839/g.147430  ORF Transcript_80839/g.147430 Transcript_80839/m.147430 type:complete len:242 (+) Transcript_80839:302-1027(+)